MNSGPITLVTIARNEAPRIARLLDDTGCEAEAAAPCAAHPRPC
ncbi:MAG: hypothetical protein QM788_11290 [Roseateles sp.]